MDVTKCEAFLAAIDHGSLTAAGVFLGYTQSGITRMINALEEEVGFPLFIRTKKGVSPTENGKAMIPAFRSIELAPIVGLSEVIVDIVETGSTLRENGLMVLEEVCSLSARMVVNQVSMKTENERITAIIKKFQAYLKENAGR